MTAPLVSMDRTVRAECTLVEPDRQSDVAGPAGHPRSIPRGSGLSYVGASFVPGGISVGMGRMDRFRAFDHAAAWVEVEAGATMGKLYRFLAPRGLRLPVQPGYPSITVGGCIAGNVHGKNHPREGVFGSHVLALELFHPRHGVLRCSPTENADIFDLTVGGFGLTGVILWARLALAPLEGGSVTESRHPIGSLEEAFREVARLRDQSDMLYAWMDLARPGAPGRGFIAMATVTGNPPAGSSPLSCASLDPNRRELRRQPVFSRLTLPWVNRLYRWNALRTGRATVPLPAFLFPALGKETYFHFFGDAGFLEQQTLIPAPAVDSWLPGFRTILARHDVPVALTTLKAFANGQRRMLHYDGDGFSFAIDVPASPAARALLDELDELNVAHGAATCIIKDSRLSSATVRRQYPEYDRFRDSLRTFDPARHFVSALSERLDL